MQVNPKESLGVEVVPARVIFTLDQKFNFEKYYGDQAKREQQKKVDSVEDLLTNNTSA
jgi:hypothetical protein